MPIVRIFSLLLALMTANFAVAQSFGEYLSLAMAGDAEAQNTVASLYQQSTEVEGSLEKAASWYLASAEQGHAEAQANLGFMYEQGHGVPQDYFEAARWYRLAAEQNLGIAQYNLGVAYMRGRGVEEDDSQAVEWFIKSCLLYTSPSPRDQRGSRMPSSA